MITLQMYNETKLFILQDFIEVLHNSHNTKKTPRLSRSLISI